MDHCLDGSTSRPDSINVTYIGLHDLVIALQLLGNDIESSQPEMLPKARGDQARNTTS
jgi:hypothetical protein